MTQILLVEDDPAQRETVTRRVERKLSVNIETASTGKDALEKLSSKNYDFALMDLGLPDMGGEEVIQQFRQQNNNSGLPIFALTSQVITEEDLEQLKNLGFTGYIKKPLKLDELVEIMKKYCKSFDLL